MPADMQRFLHPDREDRLRSGSQNLIPPCVHGKFEECDQCISIAMISDHFLLLKIPDQTHMTRGGHCCHVPSSLSDQVWHGPDQRGMEIQTETASFPFHFPPQTRSLSVHRWDSAGLTLHHHLLVRSSTDPGGKVMAPEGRASPRSYEQTQAFLFSAGVQ